MVLSRIPAAAPNRRHWWLALGGAIAIVVPACVYGPWLPLLDLLAFVGLDNAPAAASFGPLQYAVFQFTYIGHYALGRVFLSLGITPPMQIVLFYLLHGLVFFWVLWRIITWFVPETWLAAVALALGVGAYWDALFLWGGPLPFSLAQTALALALVCTLREVDDPAAPNPLWVPLLALASVVFHPFAGVFAVLLALLRLAFVPTRRAQTAGLLGLLLLMALVIKHESPEALGAGALWGLLGNPFSHGIGRIGELFAWNARTTAGLFGFSPRLLTAYFWLMGFIQLAAFALSPVILATVTDNRRLRTLAAWTLCGAVLYFCAGDAILLIAQWPERILAMFSASSFAFAFVAAAHLVRRARPAWLARGKLASGFAWAVPVAIALAVVLAQAPILRLGANVKRNYYAVRDGIVQSKLANCFAMIADIRGIEPYYLRAIPFLLVSDAQIIAKNITIFTEWNVQARHPTRLVETWFDLGRTSYEVTFTADKQGTLAVKFGELPRGQVPVPTGLYQGEWESKPSVALREFETANRLVSLGCVRDAAKHYQAALRLDPTLADARNNLGVALWQDGRRDEALEQFTKTLEAYPNAIETRCNLGDLLLTLGRPAEARSQYEATLKLNPQHPRALAGLKHLDSTGK